MQIRPKRILLQTTIPTTEDDWSIARFSRLAALLREQRDEEHPVLAVAFEAGEQGGPAIAQSTFHHFADYNWDPLSGCPSFVDKPAGDGMKRVEEALADTQRYALNIAAWLSGTSTGSRTARG